MKEIHLLGISQDSIALIFDLFMEIEKGTSFKLYPNINNLIVPSLPNKSIKYKIMKMGTAPKASSKVFFGCANPENKLHIFDYFNENHGISKDRFHEVIHSSAYIAQSSDTDNGVLIEPQVVISSQTKIGFGVFIKRGSLIGHHNVIGDYTDINPGVTISGKVKIGIGCTIGSGVVIKDNVNIGDNVIIGVGSVVTKDIPGNCIAYGNPCRIIQEI